MTEPIIKLIKYITDKKFPGIVNHVNVTRERDMGSNYIDNEKNYLYNIFIDMDDEYYDKRFEIVILIENTLKSMGITNRVAFYWN
jgi:hypothetical protein